MINGLRLQNVRSLVDTDMVEFRPITLLLGQNSSGKSTFLRALPLLKQSIRTRSNAPVLWYGDFVDFGSIREVRSTFASGDNVAIELSASSLRLGRSGYYYEESPTSFDNISVKIELFEHDESTRLRGFTIKAGGDRLEAVLDPRGSVTRLTVNDADYTTLIPVERYRFGSSELIPHLVMVQRAVSRRVPQYYGIAGRPLTIGSREIIEFFSARLHNRISTGTIRGLAQRVRYAPGDEFTQSLASVRSGLKSWSRFVAEVTAPYSRGDFDRLRALYFIAYMPEILASFSSAIVSDFQNLAYVGPSRATGERYYRHQELAVDQIDPQGRNLAMFLYSLTNSQKEQFSRWLEEAIGYSIKIIRTGGHVQMELRETGSQSFHNLADMGYGFSQVLPVMAEIWSRQQRSTTGTSSPFVTIEQPELHLHPAYQARLADVFARTVSMATRPGSRPITFIVETHSESLVNRLGELIYAKRIPPESVAVYLFQKEAAAEPTRITRSSFDENGSLMNWPIGFFSSFI